ncbi:MAG: hypothetical protein RLZZ367_1288 [Bacteroidota bacterium]|jgi:hypothetical protein
MKPFRTVVTPDKAPWQLSHADRLVSIGSCFSENIGKKFHDYKFTININPFGQQYNPYSIANAILRLLNPVPYTQAELVHHDELYHSFDHHGSYSRSTAEETLQVINTNLQQAAQDIKTATVLFLTFGTSHVFELKNAVKATESGSPLGGGGGRVVSNCHKLSGNNFTKRLMEPAEIVSVLTNALNQLRAVNPHIKIVLTVSPVRYFAFGHHENTVSKAHLFSAIYTMQHAQSDYYYFPAYELVMDDLRDYRFFAEDMLHPNYQATDYVWEKLRDTLITPQAQAIMRDTDELLLAARHRPRNPQSEAHRKFVEKNLAKMDLLEKQNSLNFSEERKLLMRFMV